MRVIASFALVLAATAPDLAQAQASRGTIFINGGAFAAIEQGPTSSGFGLPERESSGTVAGGTLGVGVHLTDRVSARVEWSLTDALRQRQDVIAFPSLTPAVPGGFTGGGPFGGVEPNLRLVPFTPETKRSTAAGFALLGYHLTAGRASIELLGGLGLLNVDVDTSYDVGGARGQGFRAPDGFATSSYHAVAVVGADAAIALTDHAAIVPQVRAYALDGALSLRPGLSLRWTF